MAFGRQIRRILGFYTLNPASIEFARTPPPARKGLARYDVSVFRLGRRAVDKSPQGRGLGRALLLRAAHRCIRVAQEVGGVALLINAKSDRAGRWYESYGALRPDDAALSLILPLAAAADALKRVPSPTSAPGLLRRFETHDGMPASRSSPLRSRGNSWGLRQ